jgi:hypothetical protein
MTTGIKILSILLESFFFISFFPLFQSVINHFHVNYQHRLRKSCDISVERTEFVSRQVHDILIFSWSSILALEPTQIEITWIRSGWFFSGSKATGA